MSHSFNRMTSSFAGPPRSIALPIKLQLVFGGGTNQFGWFFLGFSMLFFWIFFGNTTLYNLVYFSGGISAAEGVITSVQDTNMTINEREVYEYNYQFSVNGQTYNHANDGFWGIYQEGETVLVEFASNAPERSRLPQLSTSLPGTFFVIIFPIAGLFIIRQGAAKGLKGIRLLKNGEIAIGILTNTEATNMEVNDRPVYKYTFEFKDALGLYHEVTVKTSDSARFAGEFIPGEKNPESEVKEPVIYNPANPDDALMLDDLPGEPRINSNGQVETRSPLAYISLIVPGIAIMSNLIWALHVLE